MRSSSRRWSRRSTRSCSNHRAGDVLFEALKRLFGGRKKEAPLPEKAEEVVGESGRKIDDKTLDDVLWNLEIGLMEADVAVPVV
ncbi:MAG TPA: signal recognition particle receptor subunit alpha, partial [Methanomassiliicoccales archaeon]|nr:signal recognition particle receptor subunit alpha [Methanomassiliicoccales archaeon]